jgi:hypothetical protein
MVTKPNLPIPPSGQEPLKKMPKIEPMQLATNASADPKYRASPKSIAPDAKSPPADPVNKDHGASFKLPEKVSQKDIKEQSFRYGGGRSAGNRSMAENDARKIDEQ